MEFLIQSGTLFLRACILAVFSYLFLGLMFVGAELMARLMHGIEGPRATSTDRKGRHQ